MKVKKEIKQNSSSSYKITIFRTEFISFLIKNDQSCNTRSFAPHPIFFPGIKQQSLSLVYTRRKKKVCRMNSRRRSVVVRLLTNLQTSVKWECSCRMTLQQTYMACGDRLKKIQDARTLAQHQSYRSRDCRKKSTVLSCTARDVRGMP